MVNGYLEIPELEHAYYDSTRIYIENQLDEFPELGRKPYVMSCLGMAYAGLGDTVKAIGMANQVKEILKQNPSHFKGPYAMEDVAWIYTKTGDYKEALKIIRNLLSKPGPLTAKLLEIDPKWTALRDQPGFQKLIKKYSIPVVEIPEGLPGIVEQKPVLPDISGPTFMDERDGNVYHYNQIGSQTWMTQNLAYLPAVSPPDTCSITEKHYYVLGFEGNSAAEAKKTDNYAAYGVLYNWEAAMTACPEGWHLPTDQEWKTLERYLGMSEKEVDLMKEKKSGSIGKKLKYTSGWFNDGNGDNSAGFYALPGGYLNIDHTFDSFQKQTAWWTSSAVGNSQAIIRGSSFNTEGVFRNFFEKQHGNSVRCVKDLE
jgi:uncharacterized protein (TIGR02145 family)